MRKTLFALLTAFILFACKKDGAAINSRITGVWEYESFQGDPFNYQPPGNGKIIVLSEDGEFERRENTTVLFKGKYYLKKKKDCYTEGLRTNFSTNDPSFASGEYTYIDIDISGRLRLSSSTCLQDGGTSVYRKIQ
jgi:hypothetical protein